MYNKILFKMFMVFLLGGTYIFVGLLISKLLRDSICEDKIKDIDENIFQLFIDGGFIMLSIFFIRIFITLIFHNLFDGIYGFNINDIKEINGSVILSISFLYFMGDCVKQKIKTIFK